jgi:signal transduction histidine kinase
MAEDDDVRMLSRIQQLDSLSARTLVLAAFGAVLLTVGIAFAEIWAESRNLQKAYSELRDEALPAVDALHGVNGAARRLSHVAAYALMADFAEELGRGRDADSSSAGPIAASDRVRKQAVDKLSAAQAELVRALAKLDSVEDEDGPVGDQRYLEAVRGSAAEVLGHARDIELLRVPMTQENVAAVVEHLDKKAMRLSALIAAGLDGEGLEVAEGEAVVAEVIRDTAGAATTAGLLVLIIGLGASLFISRSILRPILRLRNAAKRVGQGDFDCMIEPAGAAEVRELALTFQDMTRKLADSQEKLRRQERLASLGRMAATVSHELRNPLGVVRASIFSVKERTLGKGLALERAIARMERSIDRCVDIIGDLLDFARVRDLAREDVAVDRWLADLLADYKLPQGVKLRSQLDCDAHISVDRDRMERAIANLLDNAVQALTDPNWRRPDDATAEIVVSSRMAGPLVEIVIADSGPGIDAAVQPRIFDPLFTTKNFGVGLGLPLVRQILLQHGGTVEVVGTDTGATAVVRLPTRLSESMPQEKAA